MKTNSLFTTAIFLLTLTLQSMGSANSAVGASRAQSPAYRPQAVGGVSVNSGFENLSCTQMIGNFLSYVGSSGLGQDSINRRFQACLNRVRGGGMISNFMNSAERLARGGASDAEQACLDAANREQQNLENAKMDFINSLEARENLYNLKNVSNKNILQNCGSSQQAGLVRRSSESDSDFVRRNMYNCSVNKDIFAFRYNAYRQAYSNPRDFAEYEVCYNYRVEYSRERYPPLTPRASASTAETSEAPAAGRPQVVCQSLTCEQVLQPYAVNNPSPCYRNAVINCMTGVDANSGATTVPSSRSNTNR